MQSKGNSGSYESISTIPFTMNSSFVKVPVLSKQQISIFPAKGILKGSMHTILFDSKKDKLLLIISESSIGRSAGIIDVIIIIHLSINLYIGTSSLFIPSIKT